MQKTQNDLEIRTNEAKSFSDIILEKKDNLEIITMQNEKFELKIKYLKAANEDLKCLNKNFLQDKEK